ncbi:MAG: HAMP domain-containing sensor histidine kinase [Saccharofermentans sp.]|nr:HAMP domain-containing sensor histidine kinase [Saccharofermentans sp.]
MITGFKWKKKDIKQAITEPKFGKIFIKRFLIWLGVFAIVSLIIFLKFAEFVTDYRRDSLRIYRREISEHAKEFYETDPESEDYINNLDYIKSSLATYQMIDNNYAEVRIGDIRFATDEDTAYVGLFDEGVNTIYFIEDMSYFDPIDNYMDGKISCKYNAYFNWEYDPLVELAYSMDVYNPEIDYLPKSLYLNKEKHTFIPGLIQVRVNDDLYDIDCTPADTKGYELCELKDNFWLHGLTVAYRRNPALTSKDISSYDVLDPDVNYYPCSFEDYEFDEEKDYPLVVGFSPIEERSVFELAPFTSIAIPVIAFLLALTVALIRSFIKYQRDKTVWKIFEYRTKTTEAMAHDLKTPLAAIMAYAESLEASSGDPAKVREYSKNINEKVSAMDRMIADILTLSKGETCKIEANAEDVSVMELVKLSLMEFPDMKYELNGIDARIKTDKKLLKQTVDNLLSNCDRYGDKESAVDITVSPEKLVIINKTDMVYGDAESLKEPFIKGEDSRGAKGTGLGLAIAENNLNILGFKLELESGSGIFKAIVKFK